MGKKEASSAEARFASWAPVHLDSRWRGLGVGVGAGAGAGAGVVVVVVVRGEEEEEEEAVVVVVVVRGAWMLGIEGCFGCAGGFVAVVGFVVADVVFAVAFCFRF